MLEPILGELAAELPSVDFLKLDVDRSQEIAIRYGVQAVPTLLVLRAGHVVDRFVGLRSKGELGDRLRQHGGG
jgi:thioredoxin 1